MKQRLEQILLNLGHFLLVPVMLYATSVDVPSIFPMQTFRCNPRMISVPLIIEFDGRPTKYQVQRYLNKITGIFEGKPTRISQT